LICVATEQEIELNSLLGIQRIQVLAPKIEYGGKRGIAGDDNIDIVEATHGTFVSRRGNGRGVLPDLNREVDQSHKHRQYTKQFSDCSQGFPIHNFSSLLPNIAHQSHRF
jgi:hypothetical protein